MHDALPATIIYAHGSHCMDDCSYYYNCWRGNVCGLNVVHNITGAFCEDWKNDLYLMVSILAHADQPTN